MLKHNQVLKGLFIFIVILLLSLRIAAPYTIKTYINHQLNQIPEYQGQVSEVSLSIIQGSMSIKDINIAQKDEAVKPVLKVKHLQVMLSWRALLQGHLYSKLILDQPEVDIIQYKTKAQSTTKPSDLWQEARAKILTWRINDIVINKGELHYLNQQEQPPFEITLKTINANLTGLQTNPNTNDLLPAKLSVSAQALGNASFHLALAFSPKAKTPTFKLEAQLEHLNVKAANNFLEAYTDLQATQGEFNMYIEAAAKNQQVKAYIKPFFENIQVTLPKEKEANPVKRIYKNTVNWLSHVLENNQTDKGATKIEISGTIDDPNISIWSAVVNLLQNAFLQAFLPGIDKSIKF